MTTVHHGGMPLSLSPLDATLFESSPDCVKLLDLEGRLVAMNQHGMCAMEVKDFAPLAGAVWSSLWPAESVAAVDQAVDAARQGRPAGFKAFCPTAKGTPKWWDVTVTPITGQDGRISHLLSVSRDVTASHHALARLHASEARYRSLATATAAIVWNGPACGEFDSEQPGWMEFTGQSFEQYKGWGWLDAVHPEDRAHTADAWRQALRTGTLYQVQHRLRRADGVYRHMSVRGVPVTGAQGAIQEWVGTHTDVTAAVEASGEREALLRQIQAANQRMADVFRQAPAVMCVLRGPDHVFEMVNERYLELTGRRELLGKPVREALPEVAGQGFFELLDQVYHSGEPFTGIDMPVTLEPQAGALGEGAPAPRTRYVDFVYMALRDAEGRVSGILAHGVDMTERVRATRELRASEERYRTLFKSMDQGFCIIEMLFDGAGSPSDYRFLEMNPVFEQHTGLADVAGRTGREVMPTLDRFWVDTYGQVALTGRPARFEHRDRATGRWFDVYATRLGDAGSARVALLFSDITERKRADDSLRALASDLALSDRRKTEFLATLAHELRNPLAPIRSGLAMLRMNRASPAGAARIVDVMDRQVSNMVRLIDDLLDIARISGGKLELKKERVELQAVLANAIETSLPLIESGQHAFDVDITSEPLTMQADPTRIGQVIANLLNNAAKYTPAGGRIGLTVRRDEDGVRIEVRDSGIGIPAQSLETVFDMFNQVGRHTERSHGGLGIGLSLVRRLVQMHGGRVWAASPGVGAGSTFTVRLPLSTEPMEPRRHRPAASASTADGAAGLKILVVDDNVDAAMTLGMLFEAGRHTVRLAHDGYQGVACAMEFKPDIAFLDIGMPGMDGYDTAQAMRRAPGLDGLVIVALTGWGAESDRMKSKAAGCDLHLTKPVDMAAVADILSAVGKRAG